MTSFVSKYLSLSHIGRIDGINKHTTFANILFGETNVDVAIADGTYIYIKKRGNYSFQRRSYSIHKGQPLLKPILLEAIDRYILTVMDPYLADGKK